jgi:hypothetical protein
MTTGGARTDSVPEDGAADSTPSGLDPYVALARIPSASTLKSCSLARARLT